MAQWFSAVYPLANQHGNILLLRPEDFEEIALTAHTADPDHEPLSAF